jgi:nitrite reductase/ring-hydroxylating ferredoxin subunit
MDGASVGNPNWIRAIDLASLQRDGRTLVRHERRQIAVFATSDGIFACNNRCPHEGYPLSEGSLDAGCVLTCNWHNWKFDLKTGANLDRGEGVRSYPVRLADGAVWLDVADPPVEVRRAHVMASLKAAFDDEDYERIARELARLSRLGEPLEAIIAAIDWSSERLQYGWTHAYAGMADWLTLHAERVGDPEAQLICLLEPITHLAENCLRQARHAFAEAERPWREDDFVAAIEAEDETAAIAYLRGALAAALHFNELERGFSRAALAHYNDFGHSLIYVGKAGELIDRLGPSIEAPLLFSLARSLVYTTREDLIPEFRCYAEARRAWGGTAMSPAAADYDGLNVPRALALTAEHGRAEPLTLYRALLGANARNLLLLDLARQTSIDQPMTENADWLDVTHGITFANAVRRQCTKFPELWPDGLLQMACFAGRNSGFLDRSVDIGAWRVADLGAFFAAAIEKLLDHGCDENIVAAHLLKTTLAARAEVTSGAAGEGSELVLAGLNRFLHSPLRRHHVRRTMRQAMAFVARGE